VTKVYFQLHASLRFVSLFNVYEAALAVQVSPAPAHRDFSRCPCGPVHHWLTVSLLEE